jgi:hypothetical protein
MSAPFGNQYAVGCETSGRPPKFDSVEALQEAINDYFLNGITKRKVVVGKGENKRVEEIEVPTITGLIYYVGFESRSSFYELEKRDEFSYTVKRARLFIEKEYEEQLSVGNTIGAIFALKNFGWIDKQEVNHSGDVNLNFHDFMKKHIEA